MRFGKKHVFIVIVGLQILLIGYLSITATLTPLESGGMVDDIDICSTEGAEIGDEPYYPVDMYEPDSTWYEIDEYEDLPGYVIETNSEHLRDEEFDIDKPEGVYRILVIGDSVTFGKGVNASDRYTEVAEGILDENTEEEVEVINAGRGGARMQSYFDFLYFKGLDYDPDLVVVSLQHHDQISRERTEEWQRDMMEEYGHEGFDDFRTDEEAQQEFDQMHQDYINQVTWEDSDIRKYGNLIREISDQEGFDTVFYDLGPHWPDRFETYFSEWQEECGVELVRQPENFSEHPRDEWAYDNGRQNPLGNSWMGQHLAEEILERELL